MRSSARLTVPVLLLLAVPFVLSAQDRPAEKRDTVPAVPREMLPPPGKCRIWIDGVPPKQQPAPTDCAAALRQNPSNGIVLFGPELRNEDAGRFEFSLRSEVSPTGGQLRNASLTDRRDSLKSAQRSVLDPRVPTAKDAPPPKTEPVKTPDEPGKKKPEKP